MKPIVLSQEILIKVFQVCDDFLDELLSQEIGHEGIVPDIRVNDGSAHDKHSASMYDFMVKEEPLCEDDLRAFQKDRVKKDNHNMSKNLYSSHIQLALI